MEEFKQRLGTDFQLVSILFFEFISTSPIGCGLRFISYWLCIMAHLLLAVDYGSSPIGCALWLMAIFITK